jgi:hypothetical protein
MGHSAQILSTYAFTFAFIYMNIVKAEKIGSYCLTKYDLGRRRKLLAAPGCIEQSVSSQIHLYLLCYSHTTSLWGSKH